MLSLVQEKILIKPVNYIRHDNIKGSSRALAPWLTAGIAALLLGGCTMLPGGGPGGYGSLSNPQADALLNRGDYGAAAAEFLRQADAASDASTAVAYRLRAADVLLRGGDAQAANQILESPQMNSGDRGLAAGRDVLRARAAVLGGKAQAAVDLTRGLDSADVPTWLQGTLYETRASAFAQTGDAVSAARERAALDPFLRDASARRANRDQVWKEVNGLPNGALQRLASGPDVLAGWADLALVMRGSGGSVSQDLADWQRRYPQHPAADEIVASVRNEQSAADFGQSFGQRPHRIGLLLPLTGQWRQPATAVRDGFLAAWFQDRSADRPQVSVYTATSGTVGASYAKALSEGVDFVVGPLEKEAVESLVLRSDLSTPILALNQVTGRVGGNARVIQFGLNPEDEAREVADQAWAEGHRRALALTPRSEWGERMYSAFSQRWQQLGGKVVEHQVFNPGASHYEETVAELRDNLGAGRTIAAGMAPSPGDTSATGGTGERGDFVFIAAQPREARKLASELRLLTGDSVPLIATSHVYSGQGNDDYQAMDGLQFLDMPWVLGTARRDAGLYESIRSQAPKQMAALSRLYAFGVDAYRVIPELSRLAQNRFAQFEGETGNLSLDAEGKLRRQLSRARFMGGQARVVSSSAR